MTMPRFPTCSLGLLIAALIVSFLCYLDLLRRFNELAVLHGECTGAFHTVEAEKGALQNHSKSISEDLESHRTLIKDLYDKKANLDMTVGDLTNKLMESQTAFKISKNNLNEAIADLKKAQDDLQKAQEDLKIQAQAPAKCDQAACRDLLRGELKEPPKAEAPKEPTKKPPQEEKKQKK